MPEEIFYRSFLNRDRLVHICDPDLLTCEQLSLLFRLEGFQTTFSINLAGFLAGLERRRADVVVANFELGVDDGMELLRRVKGLRMGHAGLHARKHPMVDAAVLAMKVGATDVVTKPVDTEYLVRSVRDALRQGYPCRRRAVRRPPGRGPWLRQLHPRASAKCCSSSPMGQSKQGGRPRARHLAAHHRGAPRPRHGKARRPQHRRPDAHRADELTAVAAGCEFIAGSCSPPLAPPGDGEMRRTGISV